MPATYDKLARYYDGAFGWFEDRFLGEWRAETLSLLPADSDILEIGAGTGANFRFYPESRTAVSTELSGPMIAIARSKAGDNILCQADAQSLPFGANAFDAAFATLVFCSIPDPTAAFAELVRVIRPGGNVVLLEHVRPPGMAGRVFDLLSIATVALIDDHFNRRTATLAVEAGLKLLEVRTKARGAVNLIVCEVVK
jgi:phosphatidylethanolamine/phosphatidyl-N-methylethanolamine N-methyltransferase